MIDRFSDLEEMYESFDSPTPQSNLYIITGPLGCRKTVSLTAAASRFDSKEDWLTININPNIDILEQLASAIYDKCKAERYFLEKEFSFSFSGISISIKGKNTVSSVSMLLEKMFSHLKSKGKKVLVLIDEVSDNEHIRVFAHTFQILLRESYDIYMIMTGLFENISDLQDEGNLTFLYRAPKINLPPLNMRSITISYMDTFKTDMKTANRLARLTKGYAFAYQLLGNLLFETGETKLNEATLNKFDLVLDERVYSKIYSELSSKEKSILKCAADGNTDITEISEKLNMTKGNASVYKTRLANKGLIDKASRDKIDFMLPRFKEFLEYRIIDEE